MCARAGVCSMCRWPCSCSLSLFVWKWFVNSPCFPHFNACESNHLLIKKLALSMCTCTAWLAMNLPLWTWREGSAGPPHSSPCLGQCLAAILISLSQLWFLQHRAWCILKDISLVDLQSYVWGQSWWTKGSLHKADRMVLHTGNGEKLEDRRHEFQFSILTQTNHATLNKFPDL